MVEFGPPEGTRPLQIWPPDILTGTDLEPLREAVRSFLRAHEGFPLPWPTRAAPGGVGWVLALGVEPPFVCDCALVSGMDSPGLGVALGKVMLEEDDPRILHADDFLTEWLGAPVIEVTE